MVSAAGMPLLRGSVLLMMMTVLALIPLLLSLFLDPIEAKTLMYPNFDRSKLQTAEVGPPPATNALAGHSKKGPEALPIGPPKSAAGGATVAPWRPPVVDLHYQGGPVMTQPIKCIFIWYGTWSAQTKAVILTAVNSLTPAKPIRQTPNLANWWKIVTKYKQKNGLPVTSKVIIGKQIDDHYSFGKSFSDSTGADVVYNSITKRGGLGFDKTAMYFLLTSSDVGFTGSGFCGYHSDICNDRTQADNSAYCRNTNNRIIWAFMPFPGSGNGLLNGCNVFSPYGAITYKPPNDGPASPDTGALDSFISVFLHELMEAATDPYPNVAPAYLHNLQENSEAGDLCAYTYGKDSFYYCELPSIYGTYHGGKDPSVCLTYPDYHAMFYVSTGRIFNIFGTGGSMFLVQKIWSLANKGCQLQLQEGCAPLTSLTAPKGVIERSVHAFTTIGLQTYAPGENCAWKITVNNAKWISLNFETIGTGYDTQDHVDVYTGKNALLKRFSGVNTKGIVKVNGNTVTLKWTSSGLRSPYPAATGFHVTYTSG